METKGLTTSQAKILQKEFGPNRISETHSFNVLSQLVSEIFSLLNILLIAAAGFSFFIKDYTDGILILTIVILNGLISFWQEFKAEKTLSELKKLSPAFSRTMRDGKEVQLNSELLVPGDIILLEVGDKIPADGMVIDSVNFEVNESILTGESYPVFKKPGEAEHNHVLAGTLAAAGRATVTITNIGDTTQFGKIAKTLGELKETETPLQLQIKRLALQLAGVALILSVVIYVAGIALGFDKFEMLLTAISTAVALVPEGLPSIMLITMAVGVKRMAQKKAVVRKLVAIEGLGSVNIICTDKTGTLTQGTMQVQKIWLNHRTHTPQEFHKMLAHENAKRMFDSMLVANTASLTYGVDNRSAEVLGDTTEGALLMLAHRLGIDYMLHRQQGKLVDEFSFDQNLKAMSVVWNLKGTPLALSKSAPEFMISASTKIHDGEGIKDLDEDGKQKMTRAYEALAKEGYRVLGFGYKDTLPVKDKYDRKEVESDLVFLGFAALIDPLRPEVKTAIKIAQAAGIRSVMITGDNELTAMTIAKDLGLVSETDEAMLGRDLEKISDEELGAVIERIKVFARTNPEDKLRIVKAYQKAGFSVAVTGDGVNDSLALKQAEIGVAMGKKGTDVAKEAADIVITDDNYATIINAIEEGRTIYDNVLKAIRYLLSTNIGEVLTILLALSIGLPAPLLPAQILWINLVSDGLPALALAMDPKDPHAMKRRPRDKQGKLVDWLVFLRLSGIGFVVSLFSLGAYWFVLHKTDDLVLARTWTFTVLIVLQMIVAFIIHGKSKTNFNLIGATILTLFIQFIILAIPWLHPIFEIKSLW